MLQTFEMTSTAPYLLIQLPSILLRSVSEHSFMLGQKCKAYIFSTVELIMGRGLLPLRFLQLKEANRC